MGVGLLSEGARPLVIQVEVAGGGLQEPAAHGIRVKAEGAAQQTPGEDAACLTATVDTPHHSHVVEVLDRAQKGNSQVQLAGINALVAPNT